MDGGLDAYSTAERPRLTVASTLAGGRVIELELLADPATPAEPELTLGTV